MNSVAGIGLILSVLKVEELVSMGDWLMLVCAVLAALTAGVLAGYGVCLGMFAMFRTKRPVAIETAVRVSAPVGGSGSAVEG